MVTDAWEYSNTGTVGGRPRDRVTPGRKQGVRGQGYSICKWMARAKPEFFTPSPLEVRKGSTLLSAGPQLPL